MIKCARMDRANWVAAGTNHVVMMVLVPASCLVAWWRLAATPLILRACPPGQQVLRHYIVMETKINGKPKTVSPKATICRFGPRRTKSNQNSSAD